MAIWKDPFIFQGSFKITNKQNGSKKVLIFKCECFLENKRDLAGDFMPDDYHFTYLYHNQAPVPLENPNDKVIQALYLLKYALKTTLEQFIMQSENHSIYMDEIAMSSLSERIKNDTDIVYLEKMMDDPIGFAVSIDFDPTEREGIDAALHLLNIEKLSNRNENSIH